MDSPIDARWFFRTRPNSVVIKGVIGTREFGTFSDLQERLFGRTVTSAIGNVRESSLLNG